MTISRRALISVGSVLPVVVMGRREEAARASIASRMQAPPCPHTNLSPCVQMAYGQFDLPPCKRSLPCIFEGSCGLWDGTPRPM